jgi:hypothetical protein
LESEAQREKVMIDVWWEEEEVQLPQRELEKVGWLGPTKEQALPRWPRAATQRKKSKPVIYKSYRKDDK